MNFQKTAFLKQGAVSLTLFALALSARLPALDGFITFDEPRWLDRSRWFLLGLLFPGQECPAVEWGREFATSGLGCTLQIGYPGVTTMWAGSLGLLLHYRQANTLLDLSAFLQELPTYPLDPALIPSIRFPLAVAGTLFVFFFYIFLQRLFNDGVAVVAALLVALHPFHIALSRVLHHDALTAAFMALSVLALTGYWLKNWPWPWLGLSAGLGGLALLSKQVSWLLPPYVLILAGFTWYYRWLEQKGSVRNIRRLSVETVCWGLGAGLTFMAFFPAMWVIPVQVVKVIFDASTTLAEEGHTHYFLGAVSKDPGLLFYPVGWLLRATPFEVAGLAGGLAVFGCAFWRRRAWRYLVKTRRVELALLLFVAFLWLLVTLSNKKMVRYFLPGFVMLDVFAALGLLRLLEQLRALLAQRLARSWNVWLLSGLIVLVQGWWALAHYPYYLTYYNPLFGGMPGAARLMTIIGWGEGLNEAAAYLNQQPEAGSARVVVERFCSMFRPFSVSRVFCLNSSVGGIMQADYFVYYYNLVQRNLQWPEQWRYFYRHQIPAYRLRLQGLDYVLVYRNPIEHRVDRQANSRPDVFTTFGYNLASAAT